MYILCAVFAMHSSQSSEIPKHKEEKLTRWEQAKKYVLEHPKKIAAVLGALSLLGYGIYNKTDEISEYLNNIIKKDTPKEFSFTTNSNFAYDEDYNNLFENTYTEIPKNPIKSNSFFKDELNYLKEKYEHNSAAQEDLKKLEEAYNDYVQAAVSSNRARNKIGQYRYTEDPRIEIINKKTSKELSELEDTIHKKWKKTIDDKLNTIKQISNNQKDVTDSEKTALSNALANKLYSDIWNEVIFPTPKEYLTSVFNKDHAESIPDDKEYNEYMNRIGYYPEDSQRVRDYIKDTYRKDIIQKNKNLYDIIPKHEMKKPSIEGQFKNFVHFGDNNDQNNLLYDSPKGNYYNAYKPSPSKEFVKHFIDEDDYYNNE